MRRPHCRQVRWIENLLQVGSVKELEASAPLGLRIGDLPELEVAARRKRNSWRIVTVSLRELEERGDGIQAFVNCPLRSPAIAQGLRVGRDGLTGDFIGVLVAKSLDEIVLGAAVVDHCRFRPPVFFLIEDGLDQFRQPLAIPVHGRRPSDAVRNSHVTLGEQDRQGVQT